MGRVILGIRMELIIGYNNSFIIDMTTKLKVDKGDRLILFELYNHSESVLIRICSNDDANTELYANTYSLNQLQYYDPKA